MKVVERWKAQIDSIEDGWTLEFLSLLGSTLSLAVMSILLFHYDDTPVFDWHGVTLNAYISVLSAASNSWLLFPVTEAISQWKWLMFSSMRHRLMDFDHIDSASRGPLGCFQAMCRRTGG